MGRASLAARITLLSPRRCWAKDRGDKILVFHYKRKKQYKKLQGHRQGFTALKITEISVDGEKFTIDDMPAKEAKAKKAGRPARKSAAKKAAAKAEAAE